MLSLKEFIKRPLCPFPTIVAIILDRDYNLPEISAVVKKCIETGAGYFLSFGLNAETIHDICDELIVWDEIEKEIITHESKADLSPDGFTGAHEARARSQQPMAAIHYDPIMTTDHRHQSAKDFLFFLNNCAYLEEFDNPRFLILYDCGGKNFKQFKRQYFYYRLQSILNFCMIGPKAILRLFKRY